MGFAIRPGMLVGGFVLILVGVFAFRWSLDLLFLFVLVGVVLVVAGSLTDAAPEGEGGPPWASDRAYREIVRRLDEVERRLSRLESGTEGARPARLPEEVPVLEDARAEEAPTATPEEVTAPPAVPSLAEEGPAAPAEEGVTGWELVLGEKWLQWVGLALLAVALLFLGSLAFARMTPTQKVATIYGVAALVAGAGEVLFRRRYRGYSLGLVAGGFVIAYVATLSASFLFPLLALEAVAALLWLLTLFNVAASVRYRSPAVGGEVVGAALSWTYLLGALLLTGPETAYLLLAALGLAVLLVLIHRHWGLALGAGAVLVAAPLVFLDLLGDAFPIAFAGGMGLLLLLFVVQRYRDWVAFPESTLWSGASILLYFALLLALLALRHRFTEPQLLGAMGALTAAALWLDHEVVPQGARRPFLVGAGAGAAVLAFLLVGPGPPGLLLLPLVALIAYAGWAHRDYDLPVLAFLAYLAAFRWSGVVLAAPRGFPPALVPLVLYGLLALLLLLDRRYLPPRLAPGAALAPLIASLAIPHALPYPLVAPLLLTSVAYAGFRQRDGPMVTLLFVLYYAATLAHAVLANATLLEAALPVAAGFVAELLLAWGLDLRLPQGLPLLAAWAALFTLPLLPLEAPDLLPRLLLHQGLFLGPLAVALPRLRVPDVAPRVLATTLAVGYALELRLVLGPTLPAGSAALVGAYSLLPLGVLGLVVALEALRPLRIHLPVLGGTVRTYPQLLIASLLPLALLLEDPPLYLVPPAVLLVVAYPRQGLLTVHANVAAATAGLVLFVAVHEGDPVLLPLLAALGLGFGALGWELRGGRPSSTLSLLGAEVYVLVGAVLAFGGDAGTTVVWALGGGLLLLYGLYFGDRRVRYGGFLPVFASVGKIFVVDLVGVDIEIRIAALVAVAALLLVVSFAYARFRRRTGREG